MKKWAFVFFPLFGLFAWTSCLAQPAVRFYAYEGALFVKELPKMALKGTEDPWVQDVIKKYSDEMHSNKKVADDEPDPSLPMTLAAKVLIPKPKEKLWVFANSGEPGKAKLLGTTHPRSYQLDEDGDDYEITFDADPKPLLKVSRNFPDTRNTRKAGTKLTIGGISSGTSCCLSPYLPAPLRPPAPSQSM